MDTHTHVFWEGLNHREINGAGSPCIWELHIFFHKNFYPSFGFNLKANLWKEDEFCFKEVWDNF